MDIRADTGTLTFSIDALDGSHGPGFTYLPIVYQDGCQVVLGDSHHVGSQKVRYEIEISFLGAEANVRQKWLPSNSKVSEWA